jgi:hypothetical protein
MLAETPENPKSFHSIIIRVSMRLKQHTCRSKSSSMSAGKDRCSLKQLPARMRPMTCTRHGQVSSKGGTAQAPG